MRTIKIFLLFLLMTSIIIYFDKLTEANSKSNKNDLLELIEIAEKEKINLNSWKIFLNKTVKDVTSEKEMHIEIANIKRSEVGFEWDVKTDEFKENHYIAVGYKKIKSKEIEIGIKVNALLVGNKYRIYHSYEIKGDSWNQDIREYVDAILEKNINENEVFYTLTGTMKEKNELDLRDQASMLLSKFSGTKVEGLIEDDFIAISAYSKHLDSNFLKVNKKRINLQIGLRENKNTNLINVTMGTPIIISEY
jgi:hypothetical protein